MNEISWHQLELNSGSGEISFESFNFQIAFKKYSQYGVFEYDYNTPGSEFYLTLNTDCEELNAEVGDVVGWQAKFWLNRSDPNNTPFDSRHREELVKGLVTSLGYKKNLKTWIICTPGQPLNTAPYYPKDKLIEELYGVKQDLNVLFWNKPIYEAFYHENPSEFSSIFKHYFSHKFISFDFIKNYSSKRIRLLREKFDTDLYTPGKVDQEIYLMIDLKQLFKESSNAFNALDHAIDKIKQSEHYNLSEFYSYKTEYIDHVKKLLNTLIEFSHEIIDKFNDKAIHIHDLIFKMLKDKKESIRALIRNVNETPKIDKDKKNKLSNKDFFKEDQCNEYLISSINSILAQIIKIEELLEKIITRNVHIFGKAGFGKTNLACSICEKKLKSNIPTLLILASELKSHSRSIKKQILESLSIDDSMNFSEFLGALNNLGFLKITKIPIIIDGLNETTPTADVWSHELFYLTQDIKKYENLTLITTCRESYVEQVFKDKKHYKEVENSYYLDGFDDDNIDSVIDRYFSKYNIVIANINYDKELLKNPLLLKIFSKTNQGKVITLNESNVYQTIENYLSELIERVSMQNNRKNPVLEVKLKNSINQFSNKIWERSTRGVCYPDEFFEIFDPDCDVAKSWEKTNSYKVLDEGIFISRKMTDQKEYAEFTYDLLGGFCIAKAVIFNTTDQDKILEKFKSEEVLNKLINEQDSQENHPLFEDIIGSIIYLLPRYTNKQVYEVLENDIITRYSISMISLITSTDEGRNSFSQFIDRLNINNQNIPYLLETIFLNVLNRNNYQNCSILVDTLLRMNAAQIDLNWSELIRKNSTKLLEYLDNIIKLFASENYTSEQDILNKLYFIALLFSSTNRLLRDTATKALFTIGLKHIHDLFKVFKKLEKISDLYILDRLLAALCGVIVQIDNRDLTLEITGYLEERFLRELKTTHVLILDYVNILLDYASYKYGYVRVVSGFDAQTLETWHEDECCKEEITGDGKATWGYGPVHMDFAKYIIGPIASGKYSFRKKETPTLKECLAMIVWRMKKLGYSEEIFGELDKEITKINNYNRYDNTMSVERYGKKYSWIAFFELYGYFIINNLIKPEYGNGFRVSNVDIDPTFPKKPSKMQLVTDCFSPAYNENIQDWINENKSNYLEKIYVVNLADSEDQWVLLNAALHQKGSNDTRIDIHVSAFLINKEHAESFLKYLDNNFFHWRVPEFYYLFCGEIPWSKNIVYEKEVVELENNEVEIYFPFLWYTWESYHSQMNNIGNIPFVSDKIAEDLNLNYNVPNLSYYTQNGQLATKFIWDDYSHYLYVRKDLLLEFTEMHDLSLVWYEYGSRYGDFGKGDTKLDPSFKDFKSAKILQ